ncbi:MAG: orotidine-5'-phosphate decarboxylase [Euryarchaeota archaeon TMED117]|nr:MAG: orotidine-5'-phosphate decarboxylase [Euryarchaeota archaeon TMED117]
MIDSTSWELLMEPASVWKERWESATLPMARQYMELAVQKQSLVCLAADRPTMKELNDLLDAVHPSIVALKTHVDMVDDWTPEGWASFCKKANDLGLLIFEDRKFADIGKISEKQMLGLYDIASWSDLVTAHLISGPDIVDGLQSAWQGKGRIGGVLLLAQMSSRGNLLVPSYTKTVAEHGSKHPGVFGFIGNGSEPSGISELRKLVGNSKLIWTPGINLATGDGAKGQRYGDPYEAVRSGSDCIIVGSGIHGNDNPATAAAKYAEASWKGIMEREV